MPVWFEEASGGELTEHAADKRRRGYETGGNGRMRRERGVSLTAELHGQRHAGISPNRTGDLQPASDDQNRRQHL